MGRNTWIWILIILVILGLFFYPQMKAKSLKEHREPADISKEEKGTGMGIRFYEEMDEYTTKTACEEAGYIWDESGVCLKEKVIPDWFKIGATGVIGAIVKHPPAPTCEVDSDCPPGADVKCWLGECVLANIDGMKVTIAVTNGESYNIENVYISSASPTGLANNLPIGLSNAKTLPGSGTVSWNSAYMNFASLGWVGTTQTFSVVVKGTHPLTHETITASDSVTLQFIEEPKGSFSVKIATGVPGA